MVAARPRRASAAAGEAWRASEEKALEHALVAEEAAEKERTQRQQLQQQLEAEREEKWRLVREKAAAEAEADGRAAAEHELMERAAAAERALGRVREWSLRTLPCLAGTYLGGPPTRHDTPRVPRPPGRRWSHHCVSASFRAHVSCIAAGTCET